METKWAYPELEDFDDVANVLGRRNLPFKLLTPRAAQRPMTCGLKIYLCPGAATLAHDFLVKALQADNWQLLVDFEKSAQLLAEYYTWVYPKHITRIEPVARSAFEEGKTYFESNKDFLTRKYNGEYIAIWENEVLDSDTSFSSLAQRVYKKLGYVSIYMPFVTSQRRVLRFESPERRYKANVS